MAVRAENHVIRLVYRVCRNNDDSFIESAKTLIIPGSDQLVQIDHVLHASAQTCYARPCEFKDLIAAHQL